MWENSFINLEVGLAVEDFADIKIRGNYVENNYIGAYLWDSSNLLFEGNTAAKSIFGVGVSGVEITNNTFVVPDDPYLDDVDKAAIFFGSDSLGDTALVSGNDFLRTSMPQLRC